MSTPTVGSLRRRIERLERERRQENPEMVSDDGEDHEAVDSLDLVSMSIEEFAERKVRIADLERENEDLKARIEELEERLGLADDAGPEITEGKWTVKLGDRTTEIPGKFIEVTQTTPAEEETGPQTKAKLRRELETYLPGPMSVVSVRKSESGKWVAEIHAARLRGSAADTTLFALGWHPHTDWHPWSDGYRIKVEKEVER